MENNIDLYKHLVRMEFMVDLMYAYYEENMARDEWEK